MTHNGTNSYVLTMYMNEPLNFAEGGMEHTVKVLHRFLSHSVSYNYRDESSLDPLSAHTHLHHNPCHKFCLLCIIILHFYMHDICTGQKHSAAHVMKNQDVRLQNFLGHNMCAVIVRMKV